MAGSKGAGAGLCFPRPPTVSIVGQWFSSSTHCCGAVFTPSLSFDCFHKRADAVSHDRPPCLSSHEPARPSCGVRDAPRSASPPCAVAAHPAPGHRCAPRRLRPLCVVRCVVRCVWCVVCALCVRCVCVVCSAVCRQLRGLFLCILAGLQTQASAPFGWSRSG